MGTLGGWQGVAIMYHTGVIGEPHTPSADRTPLRTTLHGGAQRGYLVATVDRHQPPHGAWSCPYRTIPQHQIVRQMWGYGYAADAPDAKPNAKPDANPHTQPTASMAKPQAHYGDRCCLPKGRSMAKPIVPCAVHSPCTSCAYRAQEWLRKASEKILTCAHQHASACHVYLCNRR